LFGVTAKSDERLIIQDAGGRSRGRSRLKRDGLSEMGVVTTAIVLTIVTPKIFNAFLRSARCRKARGYFGAADSLRDFEIFRGASVLFPITTRRLNGKNKRRVTNVKGAERISFSVCHAAFYF